MKIKNVKHQKIVDFVWIYFDEATAKNIAKHPENAVPLLKETIKNGLPTQDRLRVFASALSDAIEMTKEL